MVDNVTLNSGSGGDVIATEDIGGVEYQRVKLADGTAASTTMLGVLSEDSAAPAIVTGIAPMFERDDALATLTPIEGDMTHARVDSTGAVWVNVTNADGTNNIGTAAGSTDSGVPVLAVRDDSLSALSDPEGDYVPLRTNSTGALHVTGGGGGTEYTADVAAPAAPTGSASLMERDDALSTLTEAAGDWVQERCNANGAKWVTVDGTVTVDGSGVTQPVSGTITANLSATDNAVLDSIDAAVNGTLAVDLGANNDVTVTSGAITETNSGAILADTASMDTNLGTIAGAVTGTEMQVDVVAALPAGTNNIGDVDVASIAAGTNLVGDVGLSGARTSGGTTIFRSIDLDETEEQAKGTAGQVYWIHAMNLAAAARYLKFYNATAATVVVGTTTPVLTFPLATQGDTNGAGFTLAIPNGIEFDTAITVAATTGIADADTGAPGANEVIINMGYA